MPDADDQPFRRLGERERFDGGFFEVVTATFVGPDGFTFEREVIRHPGAVCVIPLEADRRNVLMIRQYRGAVDAALLELPAGKRDIPDEDPALCAGRELVEEVGREASSLTEVARFYNSPGISDEETICYLAEGLREVPREAHGVEEEHLVVERVSLGDLEDLMASGELVDAKSIIGLLAARRTLGWMPPAHAAAPAGEHRSLADAGPPASAGDHGPSADAGSRGDAGEHRPPSGAPAAGGAR